MSRRRSPGTALFRVFRSLRLLFSAQSHCGSERGLGAVWLEEEVAALWGAWCQVLAHREAKSFCPNHHLTHKGVLVPPGSPTAARLRKMADVLGLVFAVANTSAELHLLPVPDPDANPLPLWWVSALRMVPWETGGFPVPLCPHQRKDTKGRSPLTEGHSARGSGGHAATADDGQCCGSLPGTCRIQIH